VVPFVFTRYGRDRIHGGDPWIVVPGVRMHFTRQGFLRLDGLVGDDVWAQQTFRISNWRVIGQSQLTGWLNVNLYTSWGRAVYYADEPFLGRQRNLSVGTSLQPSARFNLSLSYDRVAFDRLSTGERVYTVNVLNSRTTLQIDRRLSLRAIVQYDSSQHQVLTDFLASYELLPGTVAYAGYGSLIERRGWDGAAWTDGPGSYRTSERGFFFKASYIHRF
jgi:hypothetical protein